MKNRFTVAPVALIFALLALGIWLMAPDLGWSDPHVRYVALIAIILFAVAAGTDIVSTLVEPVLDRRAWRKIEAHADAEEARRGWRSGDGCAGGG